MESRKLKAHRLESLVVVKARDFEPARKKIIQIAKQTTKPDDTGIKLTFCYIDTLDYVGKKIDGQEALANLTLLRKGERLKPDTRREARATI